MRHHAPANGVAEARHEPENIHRAAHLHAGFHLRFAFFAAEQFRQFAGPAGNDIRHRAENLAARRRRGGAPPGERLGRRINRRLGIGPAAHGIGCHLFAGIRRILVDQPLTRSRRNPFAANKILVLFHVETRSVPQHLGRSKFHLAEDTIPKMDEAELLR